MDLDETLAWFERKGTKRYADGLARFGIVTERRVFGVSMTDLRVLQKEIGRDHALAAALWKTDCYEARLLAALIDDPAQVTRRQMDAWARDFENWADCDTACFHLFDRTPFAFEKVRQWATSPREFVKRAAFALAASLTVHDKKATDDQFLELLPLVEAAATDDRNFVKKAVNWALRSIGKRSAILHAAALETCERLAGTEEAAPRWVGKDARRELTSAGVRARIARRGK